MDPFELLKADHEKVAKLFELLETASGKRKLDVFKRIKNELEVHTHIEESILYPALEKPEETHDLTLEAYEEHNVVKTLLAELSGAKTATDEWQAKAKVLRENVEHHVEEEEKELFDKASDALSDEELDSLGDRMAAEKARKLGQPAPKQASTRKTTAKKVGLIAALANFVGLGSDNEKASKKSSTKASKKTGKKASKKTPTKATGTKKQTTAASKSTKTNKSSKATSKPASAKAAPKRASKTKSTGSTKQSPKASGKKASR